MCSTGVTQLPFFLTSIISPTLIIKPPEENLGTFASSPSFRWWLGQRHVRAMAGELGRDQRLAAICRGVEIFRVLKVFPFFTMGTTSFFAADNPGLGGKARNGEGNPVLALRARLRMARGAATGSTGGSGGAVCAPQLRRLPAADARLLFPSSFHPLVSSFCSSLHPAVVKAAVEGASQAASQQQTRLEAVFPGLSGHGG